MSGKSALYIRMKQAVQWLKQNKQMLQKDIAAKMGITEVAFSNSMKRIQIKNDEDFIISFYQATDEIFSLEWLLNGTGDKFVQAQTKEQQPSMGNVDFSSYINALLAKSDETISSLKRELAAKDDIIQAKDDRIADLAQLAEERLHRIAELRRFIDSHNLGLPSSPFPMGMAESSKQTLRK